MDHNIITRKKDKGWQVIVSYKVDKKWKQKSKQGFESKKAAKKYGDKILKGLQEKSELNTATELDGITFKEFSEIFLRNKKQTVGNRTYLNYVSKMNKFKKLNDLEITKINKMHLDNIVTDLSDLKPKSINVYITLLNAIFNFAVQYDLLVRYKPIKHVLVPKNQKIKALTKAESGDLLNLLKEKYPRLFLPAFISANTGLRIGEVFGLKISDINFKTATIDINKQRDLSGNLKELKTNNSYRIIPIPTKLLKELKKIKIVNLDGTIFTTKDMQHTRQQFGKICRSLGFDITFHALRHTYATILIANNVDIKTVASLLGDDVKTVLDTYVHYTDEMRKKATEKVNQIFL